MALDVTVKPARIELPRSAGAGALARRHLEQTYADDMTTTALADAILVLTELVNNAVFHGVGAIVLRTQLHASGLRIEVVDEGTGKAPAIRDQPPGGSGGWGLRIVDRLALGWGAYEGTTHVWADVPTA